MAGPFLGYSVCRYDSVPGVNYRFWQVAAAIPFAPLQDTAFQFVAGDPIQLYLDQNTSAAAGLVPPPAADDFYVYLYFENDTTGNEWVKLVDGGPAPADGALPVFYATDDGTITGNPVCGTARIRVVATNDDPVLGYGADSDSASNSINSKGILQLQTLMEITDQGPPSGVQFAYGAAADENIDITATHAQPLGAGGHQDIKIDVYDAGVLQAGGAQQDLTSTNTVQSFTCNNTNFDDASKLYDARATPLGDSLLVAASGAQLWTSFVAAPAHTQNGDAVDKANLFRADPRLTLVSSTALHSLYNRGEVGQLDLVVENARAETLTRAMTVSIKDSFGGTKYSQSITGSPYEPDYTIGAADDAAFDIVGKQWTWDFGAADVTNLSGNAYSVSSKLLLDSGPVALNTDNDLNLNTNFAVYNRGESPAINYYLGYARGDPFGSVSGITQIVYNDNEVQEDNQLEATDVAGKVVTSYTIGAGDKALADLSGSPKHLHALWSGNSTDHSAESFAVSSFYYVDLHPQAQSEFALIKDNFPTEDANEVYQYVILGGATNLWAHVAGVRLDGTEVQTSGGALLLERFDPEGGLADSTAFDTGADGWSARLSKSVDEPPGIWDYQLSVSFAGNSGSASHPISHITPLTSNLSTDLHPPAKLKPGQIQRWHFQTQIEDVADEPDSVPEWELRDVDAAGNWFVAASGTMKNVVDNAAAVKGGEYYFDLTTPNKGTYVMHTKAFLNGNGIRVAEPFEVVGDKINIGPLNV